MIYTSYFSNLKNINTNGIFPIAIVYKVPNFYKGVNYKPLAPSYSILKEYKNTNDVYNYIRRYIDEILINLNVDNTVNELFTVSNNNDIVLLCYENKEKFCHRMIVSQWLNKFGYECKEY